MMKNSKENDDEKKTLKNDAKKKNIYWLLTN